ncbi:MAG TPA: signal peptidase I [Steroidobacteraceae bacterium]|nr:signal peptidase I [Steroidobacteraceae bacterium]
MSGVGTALRSFWATYWILVFIVVGACGYVFVRAFVWEPFRQPSDSMEPTITNGSIFMVSKWGYGNNRFFRLELANRPLTARVERGDLVTFILPTDSRTQYMKRVIGLPGDRIEYVDGDLTINGKRVPRRLLAERGGIRVFEERLGDSHRILHWPSAPGRSFSGTVPHGHYFMMGDFRDNSRDSRFPEVGYIPAALLSGQVGWVVYRAPSDYVPDQE